MQNFTAADLAQTTLATLAFALFLLPPGYLLGLASNLFGMRSRGAEEQLLFSLAFSFAATPIAAVLLTRISSYAVTLSFFLLLAFIAMVLLARSWSRRKGRVNREDRSRRTAGWFAGFLSGQQTRLRRSTCLLVAMALAWFVVVQCSLADLQIGHRLYVSFVAFDHSVRVSFIEAAARSGVPPRNPFYGLGGAPVLRYFYYWYVVCALPVRLFGLSPRACLNASAFWSGLGLASLVPLFLKHFCGETEALRNKTVLGVGLLTITGLDLFPYIFFAHRYHALPADMEWWDVNQVTSWMGSLLWVPHHVASLIAGMVGLLALSSIEEEGPLSALGSPARALSAGWGGTAWAVVVSGLSFASASGLSVYVTFSVLLSVAAWTLLTLRRKRLRSFFAYLASGALALALSVPYLQDLMSRHSNVLSPQSLRVGQIGGPAAAGAVPVRIDPAVFSGGERFAYFAIRDYTPGIEFLMKLGIRSEWFLEIAKLPMLLYVYVLEFGFFALCLFLYWRRERQSRACLDRRQQMAWTLLTVCLLTMSFVRSDTSGNNDLGWRGMLPAQFVLLLWAVPVLHEVFAPGAPEASRAGMRGTRLLLASTLAVGLAGTALQLTLLRIYAPLADTGRVPRTEKFLGEDGFGERTYWVRSGFNELDRFTRLGATVQYNPVRREVLAAHLYSPRQATMGDEFCGSAFGGDTERCRVAFPGLAAVFNNPKAVRTRDLDRWCDEVNVNVLVATDSDPVWHDPASWVWARRPLVANPMMRAVACGTTAGAALRNSRMDANDAAECNSWPLKEDLGQSVGRGKISGRGRRG